MDSPEDNTTVFRMMGEFKNYIAKDIERHKKDQQNREREGQLLSAQSRIAKLEAEMDSLKANHKRSRMEFEKDVERERNNREEEFTKVEELKKQLEFAVKQEQRCRKELEETRQAKTDMKANYEATIQDLRQQKLKLETTLQDHQMSSRMHISRLSNELTKKTSDIKLLQTDVEEAKTRLQHQMRRGIEASSNRRAMEEYRMELVSAQQKIKDLEQKVRDQEDATAIAKAVQNDATRLVDLERDNKQLQDEVAYYREVNENNALLKEKASGLKSKLERTEHRLKELAQLQVENEELRIKLARWESMDSDAGNRPSSPSQLSAKIASLQQGQVALLEKQGIFLSNSHSFEQAYSATKEKLASTTQELLKLQEDKKQQEDLVKRLQRRLLLLTKERDGMRQILNSYDSEVTSMGYEPQCNDRLRQAEANLQTCHRQIEILEHDIKAATEEAGKCRLENKQLESQVAQLQSELAVAKTVPPAPTQSLSMVTDETTAHQADDVQALKSRIKELEEENVKLAEKNESLDMLLERRALKGDYDPMKTKVISFSQNPAALVRQERSAEMKRLKEEAELLRKRVQVLEQGGAGEDVTQVVMEKMTESTAQEVEDLKKQLSESELRNQRLKEVFQKKIQEFREACYRLTGYQVNISNDNQYRLMSMYAERETDVLLFQATATGEMQLLENDFSSTLSDFIDSFLHQQDSIPAFLSSVTLDLYSHQTMVG
ncbi:mitotic spindle assembly checkpoint protein MAD1-like [Acanthaster planci]|uniref:Mitotic spindle assembly checkpoint protein MAD1 n=1 Tax=Acanthaster planci TaxID=133434 RepID=A0A8B7XYW8_ACAPL|nr:mitotic spindle assembly checkpoint protein MAD1-like [Acanthaster planci]